MPPISTIMHFGKIFIESQDEIDIPNFIIGIISPSTLNDDQLEELHNVDEDGNLDVREFYEKFDFETMSLKESSIVLGYYCHLWLDEYYKFNASKLKIHNKLNLNSEELNYAVKNLLNYYNKKAIGSFYEKYIEDIKSVDAKILDVVDIDSSKKKILEYLNETVPDDVITSLIKEEQYMTFIREGCGKIIKSL
ncbi:MAG: hypothetical protein PHN25_06735 [Tissierellia bacterium]|nr:hypothetical protein [Tissierellia bacterium]MDD4046332.1 hypothetical protein [Tissierellia bacterium]MDD4678875.1 hypothetical protein [Tissierellia bacterium]